MSSEHEAQQGAVAHRHDLCRRRRTLTGSFFYVRTPNSPGSNGITDVMNSAGARPKDVIDQVMTTHAVPVGVSSQFAHPRASNTNELINSKFFERTISMVCAPQSTDS